MEADGKLWRIWRQRAVEVCRRVLEAARKLPT